MADKYSNMAVITATESAANTFTAKKLETGIAIFEKMAWLISRIEYYLFNADAINFNASGDYLSFGLLVADSSAGLALTSQLCLDFNRLQRIDMGVAAAGMFVMNPYTKDFTSLAGGGILVPPNPLYLAVQGNNLVNAQTVYARLFYTHVELKPDEFWELVEARRIIVS